MRLARQVATVRILGRRSSYILLTVAAAAWTAALVAGLSRLWAYDTTPGAIARPPITSPQDVSRCTSDLPELVVLIHPKCPCSRATVGELARLMTDCQGKLAATVLVVRPAGVPEGWERTDLWTSAAAIPGVTVRSDSDGEASRRFGAATSGQVLLYGTDGRLLFSGGITASRGHHGDNAGRAAITSLVLGEAAERPALLKSPVYGCQLFDTGEVPPPQTSERSTSCPIN